MTLFDQAKSIPITDIINAFHSDVTCRNVIPCPFHTGDRSPSFTIYERTNSWCCFGCGAGGDGINFVAKLHGISNKNAAILICQNFGLPIGNQIGLEQQKKVTDLQEKRKYDQALQRWANAAYVKLCGLRRQHDLICSHPAADSTWHVRLLYIDYLLDILQFGPDSDRLELFRATGQGKLGLAGAWINGTTT